MSTTSRRERIESLFEGALERPAGERTAWLASRCGDDRALRDEVDALLVANDRAEGILEADAAGAARALAGTTMERQRIGPWRVLRELGRGGMGVVYLAARDDGQFRRTVAIKLLRNSPDAEELHRRFRAERQILASLDHPNIAQLLDGGVTEGQLPYLVMEHVDGLPITAWCDRHRLTIEARLRLFERVCAAVHHAHKNLVIHRDLKPSNILVTADGTPKLLDFGIAKLLNPDLAALDLPMTRTGHRLMTPDYASPEQVRGEPLTTASDVYSLGVVLYELLAGRAPYRLTRYSPQEIAEVVCGHEPERPSVAAARAASDGAPPGRHPAPTVAAVAAARDTTPARLAQRLRGDVDAIVMMALRKEPARRYGSAELLAEDIRRHLESLPVLAHRGSRWYRARKLLHRHRVLATAASAVALSLVAGAGASLSQARLAARERDRAAEALAQSEEVTGFLVGLFEASDPTEGRADTLTAADLLRRGMARAERLADEPVAQARLLEALGRVYAIRAEYALSAELLARALTLRRTHLGAGHPSTAVAGAELAEVLRWRGRYAEADTLAREALRVRRLALGDAHQLVASSLRQCARLAVFRNDLAAAERYAREAVAVDRGAGREGRGADSALAASLEQLGAVLWRRGDDAGSEAARREALAVAERAFPGPHDLRAGVMLRLADLLDERLGTWGEVERLYRDALAETRAIHGDAHSATGQAMKQLGEALERHGRRAEAERLLRDALALQRRTLGPAHPEVAGTMLSLARLLADRGYSPEAERLAGDAVALTAATYGAEHTVYAGALGYLADVIAQRGALDSAEALYRRAIAIRAATFGPRGGITALTSAHLAALLVRRGRLAEADSLYRESTAAMLALTGPTNLQLRHKWLELAALQERLGRPDSAAKYRRLAAPPLAPMR